MSAWRRKPVHAALLEMIDLEEFHWPITYTYFVTAPWGTTRQQLTVNAPGLYGNDAASEQLGKVLWSIVTAPAVIGDVSCSTIATLTWKGAALAVPKPVLTLRGNLIGSSTPRDRTPQMCMLTGHGDNDGRRRFFFPGAPSSWQSGGLLTTAGFEHLLPHAAGCMLGLATPELGSGLEWLLAYPGVIEPHPANLTGTAFRRVTHCRVLQHTDKAPEVTGLGDL